MRRWFPVVAWLLVMWTLSTGWFTGERTGYVLLPVLRLLLPWATLSQLIIAHNVARKLAHFGEYLVLGLLLYRALDGARTFAPRAAGRALALAAVFAIVDETHQLFVAGRTAALTDCLIDLSGAATGLALVATRTWVFTTRVEARS